MKLVRKFILDSGNRGKVGASAGQAVLVFVFISPSASCLLCPPLSCAVGSIDQTHSLIPETFLPKGLSRQFIMFDLRGGSSRIRPLLVSGISAWEHLKDAASPFRFCGENVASTTNFRNPILSVYHRPNTIKAFIAVSE